MSQLRKSHSDNSFVLRMLFWNAQHYWKSRKNYIKAAALMQESLSQLHEIWKFDKVMEQDVLCQLKTLKGNEGTAALLEGTTFFRAPKNYVFSRDELKDAPNEITCSTRKKKIDLFVNPVGRGLNFEIHGDEDESDKNAGPAKPSRSKTVKPRNDVPKKATAKRNTGKSVIDLADENSVILIESSPELLAENKNTNAQLPVRQLRTRRAVNSKQ